MTQEVVTLATGNKLSMQVAAWKSVGFLRWVLARELKAVNLDFSSNLVQGFLRAAGEKDKTVAMGHILKALGGEEVDTVKNVFLQLLGSSDLETCLFDCMHCCTYNGVKIVPDTFEPESAREDFYPIVWEVLKLNLRPFSKTPRSMLSTLTPPKDKAQK